MSDTYIDSRGAEMAAISFSAALDLVTDLASGNQIDERDIAFGDRGLGAQRKWQEHALHVLQDLLANHRQQIDVLKAPTQAGDWDDSLVSASRDMDPGLPTNAIRICLDMAVQGALDPRDAERDPHLADEVDRQQLAFDVVRDLLGIHGRALETIRAAITTSSFGPSA